jgi:hypothetical protein
LKKKTFASRSQKKKNREKKVKTQIKHQKTSGAQLEWDLAHVKREREKAQSSRAQVLIRLKADLLDVKETTEVRGKNLQQKYETRCAKLKLDLLEYYYLEPAAEI